jgi:hypothetical protein
LYRTARKAEQLRNSLLQIDGLQVWFVTSVVS